MTEEVGQRSVDNGWRLERRLPVLWDHEPVLGSSRDQVQNTARYHRGQPFPHVPSKVRHSLSLTPKVTSYRNSVLSVLRQKGGRRQNLPDAQFDAGSLPQIVTGSQFLMEGKAVSNSSLLVSMELSFLSLRSRKTGRTTIVVWWTLPSTSKPTNLSEWHRIWRLVYLGSETRSAYLSLSPASSAIC